MKVAVFCEQRDGKLKTAALEALTIGSKIAGGSSDCTAILVGSNVAALADELKNYGCDKVLTVDNAELENYNPLSYADALEQAMKSSGASTLIATASPMGRDLSARLAARLDAGLLTDVVELEAEGDCLIATKPMYAGKCLAKIKTSNCTINIASIRPNTFKAETTSGDAKTESVEFSAGDYSKCSILEIRKGASEKADLTEASVIVSGGRAMGSADKFSVLHELADTIGATVGASRAAVDSGYATHDMQVGQTGKTVNPNLYIACGISGAIQHLAGMRTAKTIVAINTDPEAPIFKVANYGLVADLFEAVPLLNKKLKELL